MNMNRWASLNAPISASQYAVAFAISFADPLECVIGNGVDARPERSYKRCAYCGGESPHHRSKCQGCGASRWDA